MKYLACVDWDAVAQTCNSQAWVDQSTWIDYLPSVADAHLIGLAFLGSWVGIASLKRLLKPPKEL